MRGGVFDANSIFSRPAAAVLAWREHRAYAATPGSVRVYDSQSPGNATAMLPGEAYTIDEAMERLEQAWDERVDIEDASAS